MKNNHRSHTGIAYLILISILLMPACGQEEEQTEYADSEENGSTRYAPIKQKRETQKKNLIEIPIQIEQASADVNLIGFGSLNLAAAASATSYKIQIASCISGYTQNDVASSTVYVYEFDTSCTAQVTEIVFDTVTYDLVHDDAVAWDGTTVGSVATLVATSATAGGGNSLDSERLEVVLDATFSATVNPADVLTFSFRQFVKDTANNTLNVSVVDDGGHSVTVEGNKAPNFTIEEVTLKSLDGTDGFGTWDFKMLCGSELTTANTKCDDVLLTDIQYTLILDTFGGGEPTRANLDDAISGAGLYTLFAANSLIAGDVNNSIAASYNGGFNTLGAGGSTYVTLTNATRTNIHTDTNMILVLVANKSYRYFHVDLTQVSN